ncbi:MAG: hypothetical protein ACE37F_13130 [Nannocystaceae bacterium]|nr:hypothetical protein [bacterium]
MDAGLLDVDEILAEAAKGQLNIDGVSDVHRDDRLAMRGLWIAWNASTLDWVTFRRKNVQRAVWRARKTADRRAKARSQEMAPGPESGAPIVIGTIPAVTPGEENSIPADGESTPADLDEPSPEPNRAPAPTGQSENETAPTWSPALTIEDHLRNLGKPLAAIHIKEPSSIDPDHIDELRWQLNRLQIPAVFFAEDKHGDHLHGLAPREHVLTVVELYLAIAGDHGRGEDWVLHSECEDDQPHAAVLTKDFEHSSQRPIEFFTSYCRKAGGAPTIDTVTDWIQS